MEIGRLTAWTTFFRTRLLPTPWMNAATGAIACGALAAPPEWHEALLALLAVTALYLFGMGANDWRDRHRDARLAPHRPLPSGAIRPRSAALALVACLLTAGISAIFLPSRCLPWAGAALSAILLYDFVVKDHAWVGPLAMGSVRSFVVLLGGSVIGDFERALLPALVIGGHGFWVTRYSLEEERARPPVLDARARAILAHSLGAFFCTATFVDAAWTLHLGWVPLLVAWAHFDRARRVHPPGWFTFRSLRAFLLLDGALQLSYNSPFSALLGLFAFFWTGRRSRGPTPAGPAGATPPDAVPSEEEAS